MQNLLVFKFSIFVGKYKYHKARIFMNLTLFWNGEFESIDDKENVLKASKYTLSVWVVVWNFSENLFIFKIFKKWSGKVVSQKWTMFIELSE